MAIIRPAQVGHNSERGGRPEKARLLQKAQRQLTVRGHMQSFKVRCYEAAKWDGIEPHDIEAQDEREAAEIVCGGPLIGRGKPPSGSPRCPDRVWHASPLVSLSMRRARRLNGLQIGDRELPEGNGLLRPLA